MNPPRTFNDCASSAFRRQQRNLLSILDIEISHANSLFLIQMKEEVSELSVLTESQLLENWRPNQHTSRDSLAVSQGLWNAPHISVLSQVCAIQRTVRIVTILAENVGQVASHTLRQQRRPQEGAHIGTSVFLGHGHSQIWWELKDFLKDQLSLPVDEFNGVPGAGIPTSIRLPEMLDTAAIAFFGFDRGG